MRASHSIFCLPILLAASGVILPTSAHAFSLGDHKRIMLQAISEFERCYPGRISGTDSVLLWTSDLDEDLDIIRKDVFYSHFFNPNKHLKMRRQDSMARVHNLQEAILGDMAQGSRSGVAALIHLGHAVHHIQDMASPPHVVPVMHGLTDGFEKYDFDGDIASSLSCAELAHSPALEALLVETAKATLNYVGTERFEISFTSPASPTPLKTLFAPETFWQDSGDDDFGQYGILGNHYGSTSFTERGTVYSVSGDFYQHYKQRQLKLGVRSTLKALYWMLIGDQKQ